MPDDLGLAALLRSRIGEAFDGEAHLTDDEANFIADALERRDATIERLLARQSKLEEALKPFARYTDELNGFLDNHNQPIPDDQGPGWVYVTIGDFRRARQALKD